MALQSPFFNNNKRDVDPFNPRHGHAGPAGNPQHGAQAASAGATQPASAPAGAAAASTVPATAATARDGESKLNESKLTVGPNIKLKGVEITDCDTLVVEGMVEATMDSRVIQISQRGAFRGSAEIDIAEIHGQFDGNLTVRDKLVIYATGKVTGHIRYGKVVIEEGGELSGEIEHGAAIAPRAVRHATAVQGVIAAA